MSQPCTCSTNYTAPTIIPCLSDFSNVVIPNYFLTHTSTVTIPSGAQFIRIDAKSISVAKGDIIGFQSEFLDHVKCEENNSSIWAHPKVDNFQINNWMNGGDKIDLTTGLLKNGVVCEVGATFNRQVENSSPSTVNYLTEPGEYLFNIGAVSEHGKSVNCSVMAIDSIEGLSWVYPPATSVMRENNSELVVTTQLTSDTLYTLVVKLLRGSDALVEWTIDYKNPTFTQLNSNCPSLQTTSTIPESCQHQTSFLSDPYASLDQTFAYNPTPVELVVNASNQISQQVMRVKIFTFEKITTATISHSQCQNTGNSTCEITVEVEYNETFFVNVQPTGVDLVTLSENGVVFSLGTSNMTSFSRKFATAGTYTLQLNASNPVSFMNSTIIVKAYLKANFANLTFVNVIDRIALGDNVDIRASAFVTFGSYYVAVWSLGSKSSAFEMISSDKTAITPTIPITFQESGSQTVSLRLEDAFGNKVSVSMVINVYKKLESVVISASSIHVATGSNFTLTIAVDNTTSTDSEFYGLMNFALDFNDGTDLLTWNDTNAIQNQMHSFESNGTFTVSIYVYSYYESSIIVQDIIIIESQEPICQLILNYNGPKHVNTTVTFQASIGCGSHVLYSLDTGDGHVYDFQAGTQFSHIYTYAAVFEAKVTAKNNVSTKTHKLTLYAFDENFLQIIKVSGRDCVALNHTITLRSEVAAEHPLDILYDWNFGNGLVSVGTGIQTGHTHYWEVGLFMVTLVVTHPLNNKTDTHSKEVCAEEIISGVNISYPNTVALYPPSGDVDVTMFAEVKTGSNLTFTWDIGTLSGFDGGETIVITVNTAGNYSISLKVSNDIGRETETVYLVVEEIITGLELFCLSCYNSRHAKVGEVTSFRPQVVYGTNLIHEWSLNNSLITSNANVFNHTFVMPGDFKISVISRNGISQNESTLMIQAQEAISNVALQTNTSFVEVNHPSQFSVSFLEGSHVSISWSCTGILDKYEDLMDVVLSFGTTGYKQCTVSLTNFVSSQTATQRIPVIEAITQLAISNNMTRDSNNNLYASTGGNISFSAEINTEFLVDFLWEITQNGNIVQTAGDITFTFTPGSVGTYNIKLAAKNYLGLMEVTFPFISHERISNLIIRTNSTTANNMLINESLEFQVTVASGTALQYEWRQNNSLLQYSSDILTLSFTDVGETKISCLVSNVFGFELVETTIIIFERVSNLSIHINDVNNTLPYVMQGSSLSLSASGVKGSDISFQWTITHLSSKQEFSYLTENLDFQFSLTETYTVVLNVSNARSSESQMMVLQVQTAITFLQLVMTDNTIQSGSLVNFSGITNVDAMNVTYTWNIGSVIVQGQTYAQSFNIPGDYIITVTAANDVSSVIQTQTLSVQDPIQGLRFENCSAITQALTNLVFEAALDSGSNVSYSWAIQMNGRNTTFSGSILYYIFQQECWSLIHLTAENRISKTSVDCSMSVQLPVSNVALAITYPSPDFIFMDEDVIFTVSGDNFMFATFDWTIQPFSSMYTSSSPTLNTTFSNVGNYTVTVVVKNAISQMTVSLDFTVRSFMCDIPVVKIVGAFSKSVIRSHVLVLEIAVDPNGCTQYIAVHSWKVYRADNCNGPLTNAMIVSLFIYSFLRSMNTFVLLLQQHPFSIKCSSMFLSLFWWPND